jgi:hypothetical protein
LAASRQTARRSAKMTSFSNGGFIGPATWH